MTMTTIYKTKNFVLETHERPEIDRLEGGHITISPKKQVKDRTELTPKQATELMRLTVISGIAMKKAMKKIGVNIGRINYQENGNWNPHLHIHLYCRSKNARMQKYGDPIIPGHKKQYKSLNKEDVKRIRKEIEKLLKLKKFSEKSWGLC